MSIYRRGIVAAMNVDRNDDCVETELIVSDNDEDNSDDISASDNEIVEEVSDDSPEEVESKRDIDDNIEELEKGVELIGTVESLLTSLESMDNYTESTGTLLRTVNVALESIVQDYSGSTIQIALEETADKIVTNDLIEANEKKEKAANFLIEWLKKMYNKVKEFIDYICSGFKKWLDNSIFTAIGRLKKNVKKTEDILSKLPSGQSNIKEKIKVRKELFKAFTIANSSVFEKDNYFSSLLSGETITLSLVKYISREVAENINDRQRIIKSLIGNLGNTESNLFAEQLDRYSKKLYLGPVPSSISVPSMNFNSDTIKSRLGKKMAVKGYQNIQITPMLFNKFFAVYSPVIDGPDSLTTNVASKTYVNDVSDISDEKALKKTDSVEVSVLSVSDLKTLTDISNKLLTEIEYFRSLNIMSKIDAIKDVVNVGVRTNVKSIGLSKEKSLEQYRKDSALLMKMATATCSVVPAMRKVINIGTALIGANCNLVEAMAKIHKNAAKES